MQESSDRRWVWALVAICAVGLGIRAGYVLGWHDLDTVKGDPYYYHHGANLLADGEGYVHPFLFDEGIKAPGADHPPAYLTMLALPSVLGLDGIRDHQLFSCILGTGTVALVGLLGRRVGGKRVGLVAAGIAAIYPNIWLNDAAVMSETPALFFGVAASLAAYWAWDGPTPRRFAVLGALIGLGSLARSETIMLLVLMLVPMAIWTPGLAGARVRLARAGVAVAACAVAVAPWVGPNMVRFEHPATLSTQMDATLASANCHATYYGPFLGSWSLPCAYPGGRLGVDSNDTTVLGKRYRKIAFDYISSDQSRVPTVAAARLGRTFGVYAVGHQKVLDEFTEDRPTPLLNISLAMYYVLALASIAGIVVLRRRRTPSFPVVVWIVAVAVTVVLFYGSTRFRAPAEPAFAVLAAVAVDQGLRWLTGRGSSAKTAGLPGGDDEPSPSDSELAAT